MVNKVVSGAHYGTRDWIMQRVTAIVIALYTVLFVVVALSKGAGTFAQWQSIFASPFMKIASLVAFVCLCLHAWVGMRDILMDYIQPTGLRLTLQCVVIFALLAYAAWAIHILWGVVK